MNASPNSVGCFWSFFKDPPVDKQFGKIPAEISGGIFGPKVWPEISVRKFRSEISAGKRSVCPPPGGAQVIMRHTHVAGDPASHV